MRLDIQGLRAVAVMLVALGHAGVPWLHGGFVGVDVFFVISGFLITGWLLRRTERARRVPYGEFYAARARRILPAATLAIVATVGASLYCLNYVRAWTVMHDATWAASLLANVHFAQERTNYFDASNPTSPLQHFWSLAVEEQFYLVCPFVIAAALLACRRKRVGGIVVDAAAKRRVGLLLACGVAASFAFSLHATAVDPLGAYFSTMARAWELGVGALLAVCSAPLARLPGRALMSWVGVLGILIAAVVFGPGTPFPGLAALLPVMSTALVLLGGLGSSPSRGAVLVLGRQPFRLVGDVSYSFYLWHWPVLALAMDYERRPLPLAINLLLLSGAFLISVLTYRFFENPIRRSMRLARPSRALTLYPATIALAVAAACVGIQWVHATISSRHDTAQPQLFLGPSSALAASRVGPAMSTADSLSVRAIAASVTASHAKLAVPTGLVPAPENLAHSYFGFEHCSTRQHQTSADICTFGDAAATRTLVVFGDSHAEMWIPALTYLGTTQRWRVMPITKPGCEPQLTTGTSPPSSLANECHRWYAWALRQITRLKPRAVVVGQALATMVGQSDAFQRSAYGGLANELADLRRLTPATVLIQDIPSQPHSPVDCLLAAGATLGSCGYPRTEADEAIDAHIRSIAGSHGTGYFRTLQWFCYDRTCPAVVGDIVVIQARAGHVTAVYARELRSAFALGLGKALPGPAVRAESGHAVA